MRARAIPSARWAKTRFRRTGERAPETSAAPADGIVWPMVCTILTPELVLLEAMICFVRAHDSRNRMEGIGYKNITLAHGFLVETGNLNIQFSNEKEYPLTSKVLKKLYQNEIGSVSTAYHSGSLYCLFWSWGLVLLRGGLDREYFTGFNTYMFEIILCVLFAHCFSWAKPRYMREPVVLKGVSATLESLSNIYAAHDGPELARKIKQEKNILLWSDFESD